MQLVADGRPLRRDAHRLGYVDERALTVAAKRVWDGVFPWDPMFGLVVRCLSELTPPAFWQGKVSEQLVGRFVGSRSPCPFRPAALDLGESFASGHRAWIHERNGKLHH